MTRKEKIIYIKRELPYLFEQLSKSIPHLVSNPDQASKKNIIEYNKLISNYIFKYFDFYLIEKLSF